MSQQRRDRLVPFNRANQTWRPASRLVLHRSSDWDILSVTRTIMELLRLGAIEASNCARQAEQRGQATLMVTHKERAELYVDRFANRGLKVTIDETTWETEAMSD
ncbi:MAG: hypothetical protein KatS3mg105_2411 [Gemmatales bacterium]|nr:MAG: hypothetical protein KatS3mg105_2411 [Gemmatales bacterium]